MTRLGIWRKVAAGEKNTLRILIVLMFLKTSVAILSVFIFPLKFELEACKCAEEFETHQS